MTTPTEAIAAYRQYQARQAGDAEQQRLAAVEEAERRAGLPDPRDTLRATHTQRAAAQDEVGRLRTALHRARDHQGAALTACDTAKRILEEDVAANTATLIAELATGSAGRVEPVAGEQRVALADAEDALEVANRAVDKLAGDLEAAETRLAVAGARIDEAVCAMLLDVALVAAEAILRAADELDAARADLDALALQVTNLQRRMSGAARLPWPSAIHTALSPELRGAPRLPSRFASPAGADLVRRWSAAAAALSVDPEAEI